MRPLPQLTPFNEWFWSSGADGRLRIQGCADCKALVHPPTPICRHVLCFRTVWESTFASLGLSPGGGGRVSGATQEWRAPFGARWRSTSLPAGQRLCR